MAEEVSKVVQKFFRLLLAWLKRRPYKVQVLVLSDRLDSAKTG